MANQSSKEVFEFGGDQVADSFRDPDEPRPWWLLNFYFELPFYLPYLDGATFNVRLPRDVWVPPVPADLPDTPFVLLSVIQTRVPPPPDPSPAMTLTLQRLLHARGEGGLGSAFDDLPASGGPLHITSIVEAITPKVLLKLEADSALPHHPTTYINRCLGALNLWVRTIASLTMRASLRTVQPENLPRFVPFFHQRPNDGRIVRLDVFQAHENPATSLNSIATLSFAERARLYAASIDDTHGIFKAREWCHTSLRLSIAEGRYDLAMVALNTSFEVLVFGLARVLLVDEGMHSAGLEAEFANRMGIGTVCHRYIEPRLGGRWDDTDASCPLGEVTAQIVDVRNKVAHQGLSVSSSQVAVALTSFTHFTDFLVRRVAAKKHRFPRTCMDLINAFGQPTDVTVGQRFDKAAQAIVKATPKYWLPADDPRQSTVPSAIVQSFAGTLPVTIRPEKASFWATTNEPFMHLVTRADRDRDPVDGGSTVE